MPVMEYFYTIQGEGQFAGSAAYFIRLAGCDVGCHWCDVKESWEVDEKQWLPIKDLIHQIQRTPVNMVVITGGEPAMYNLEELTAEIKNIGKRTHIETSGAYEITGHWDWVTLSPKKFKAPVDSSFSKANELKVVVFNKHDFKWAEENAQKVSSQCQLLLQPEWDRREEIMPLIVDFVKENPRWKASLQTHKYLNVP